MKILISTGIYPPQLGGPAKYAKNLKEEWEKRGFEVVVKTFTIENKLLSGIRHLFFLLKIIPTVVSSDFIFALDTFSVGMPSVFAAKIFGKKVIMRTGGDFLWESYVERTGDTVLFKDFYNTTREKWSRKEKYIFNLTKWTLQNVSALIFSTEWQKDIFTKAYDLKQEKLFLIENYYGEKLENASPKEKNFIAGTRKLKWKNLDILPEVFEDIPQAKLDLDVYSPADYMDKIKSCYATILVSLGDISPNMILESIRFNKPFIITEENGLMNRISHIAITVNPKNKDDIKQKVLWLLDSHNYEIQVEKIKNFNFVHVWKDIADEILIIHKKI